MKYTNSIYTPNLSGKQGNIVFSSNQYGPYTADKSLPFNPNTEAQQKVRSGTASIARIWSTLTSAQRQNWCDRSKNFAFYKKGIQYFLPGFYFFMKLNRNLYEVNEPIMRDCPSFQNYIPQEFSNFQIKMVDTPAGKDLLLFIFPTINSNTKIKLFASKDVKTSEMYGTHRLYKIAILDSNFVSGSSIKDYYIKKYVNLPASNGKAFFDYISTNINSGFTSLPRSSEVFGI